MWVGQGLPSLTRNLTGTREGIAEANMVDARYFNHAIQSQPVARDLGENNFLKSLYNDPLLQKIIKKS